MRPLLAGSGIVVVAAGNGALIGRRAGHIAASGCLYVTARAVVRLSEAESNTAGKQNSGAERQNFIFHVVEIEWFK